MKPPSTLGHESLIPRRPSLSHPGWLKYFFSDIQSVTLNYHTPRHKARLVSELRTTSWRPVKQIRSANLLHRLDKCHFDEKGLTNLETTEEKKANSTVFFSNYSQTSMLPQSTSPSLTPKNLHQASPFTEVISPVHVVKRCPSCCAWIVPITTD